MIVLGILIIVMDGKSVDSGWHRMEEVIKYAISLWPIAFAAVTAQGMILHYQYT